MHLETSCAGAARSIKRLAADEAFNSRLGIEAAGPGGMSARKSFIRASSAVLVGLLMLMPLLLHAGWPYNHDGERPVTRMAILVAHWELGQLIPVWATDTVMGYGSPSPILYHKTFTYLSAAFYIVIGSAKAALVATILTFMVIGFLGAGACVRCAGVGRRLWIELLAGFMLVSCNYATTDWLIRGADAEFAVFMLSPWVFSWCMRLIRYGWWSWWIGPAMAIVFLTHSSIGLFFVFPLTFCLVLSVVRWGPASLSWCRPAVISLVVFTVLVAPFATPMWRLVDYARAADFLAPGFNPRTSHLPVYRFLWDDDWHWGGSRWGGFSPQIDSGLLLLFVCSFPIVLRDATSGWSRDLDRFWLTTFLYLTIFMMLFLQTTFAFPLFDLVRPLQYIQFSWRLLSFISIGLVIVMAMTIDRIRVSGFFRTAALISIVLALSTIANKPWFTGMPRPWFSPAEFSASARTPHDTDPIEYTPHTPAQGYLPVMQALRDLPGRSYGCRVMPLGSLDWERATSRFSASCDPAGQAALPVFLVRGLQVEADGHPARIESTCDDPRTLVALPAGTTILTVRFPTWESVVFPAWSHAQATNSIGRR